MILGLRLNFGIGFQYFHIRIGDMAGNYYKYTASPSLLTSAHLNWKQSKVPIGGNAYFSRTFDQADDFVRISDP
jgi:hypothetical protein